jgi:hypothetical protein
MGIFVLNCLCQCRFGNNMKKLSLVGASNSRWGSIFARNVEIRILLIYFQVVALLLLYILHKRKLVHFMGICISLNLSLCPVICLVQIRFVINSNVCPCVGLVKLHCRLISTQENFPQERTALELMTLVLYNFPLPLLSCGGISWVQTGLFILLKI